MSHKVAIIMGSDSDWKVMEGASLALKEMGVSHSIEVVSAHRTPDKMIRFAKKAEAMGIKVIIAGAGGAAHLPGIVASATTLPVVGVPVQLKTLNGLDSLLSIVQMPKGVPVATMAIDNSYNAGLLAARIVGLSSKPIRIKLANFQKAMKVKVKAANVTLKKKIMKGL